MLLLLSFFTPNLLLLNSSLLCILLSMVPIRNLHKRNFFLFYRWTIIDCLPLDYHCLLTVGPLLIAYRWTIIDCLPLDYHCLLTVGLSLLAYLGLSLLAYRWTIIAWSTVGQSLLVFTVGLSLLFFRYVSFLNLLDGGYF